jgi:hypothetical protein
LQQTGICAARIYRANTLVGAFDGKAIAVGPQAIQGTGDFLRREAGTIFRDHITFSRMTG